MLKSLLQLFVEKFLQSKSEWISYQANPNSTAIYIQATKNNEWNTVVSPVNGWFCIKALSSKIILSNGELWQGVEEPSSSGSSYKGFCIPVSKGWSITYTISNTTTQDFAMFVPSIGNK